MTNLADNLHRRATEQGSRVAVRLDDVALSYADLDALTARVAGRLHELGVRPGDRIGIMLPNVPAFPVVYYGVLRAGGTVVPMSPLLKGREVEHYLGDSGARLAFVWTTAVVEAVAGAGATCAQVVTVDAGTLDAVSSSARSTTAGCAGQPATSSRVPASTVTTCAQVAPAPATALSLIHI